MTMANTAHPQQILPEDIMAYYREGKEAGRLFKGIGPLELARTKELISRAIPPPPAVVLDVGGGPGTYACWLAQAGYEVHLVDAVPLHVEQANQASQQQPAHPIASINLADARNLDQADNSVDAVLLLGPLYHLTEKEDRLEALREARRVLRPGGLLLAVGISRYASAHVGLSRWWIDDPVFCQMVKRELADGQHIAPAGRPHLFTRAFFHRPDELKDELEGAGYIHRESVAVEGSGWIIPDFEEHWANESEREALLTMVRWMEKEPAALGISPHIMAIGEA
jgi:ubiquinone/menaquinone biosynthesis C-methylase UbiE